MGEGDITPNPIRTLSCAHLSDIGGDGGERARKPSAHGIHHQCRPVPQHRHSHRNDLGHTKPECRHQSLYTAETAAHDQLPVAFRLLFEIMYPQDT